MEAPINSNNSNKRSRSSSSVPHPEAAAAEDDDHQVVNNNNSDNIKDAILAIDSKSVYAHAINNKWTSHDLEEVESKVKELQASLDKAKKEIEYERQKRYKSTSIHSLVVVPAAAAAAPTGVVNAAQNNAVTTTIASMETVVQHVSTSGFLSAEDVGRFLLCTCKALTAPLTEDFIGQAITNSTSCTDRYDHVPRSILEKHGHKWIYEKLLRKNNDDTNEDAAAAVVPLMQQPTTLSAENLTLSLQIFSRPEYGKLLSFTLTELNRINFAQGLSFAPSPEEAPAFFEQFYERDDGYDIDNDRFRTQHSNMHAIVHGFREDTNQVVRLLDCDGFWEEEDDEPDLQFLGLELDSCRIQLHMEPLPWIERVVIRLRFLVNGEPDPDYNFFRALHHFAPWEG